MLDKLKSLFRNNTEQKSIGYPYSLLGGRWWGDYEGASGWKYDRYAWLGYMQNPISYRAVNIIADAVATGERKAHDATRARRRNKKLKQAMAEVGERGTHGINHNNSKTTNKNWNSDEGNDKKI